MKLAFLLVALSLAFALAPVALAEGPATQPASTTAGDVRVETLKPCTYAYISTTTTLAKLGPSIDAIIPKIDAAVASGDLKVAGPAIFTYHGMTADPQKEFTLDIGIMVRDGSKPPEGFTVTQVPSVYCAQILYTGDVTGLPAAYGKLYAELNERGLQPTDVSREVYYYWEGRESPNNVMGIQVELAPTNWISGEFNYHICAARQYRVKIAI